jgi:hypothetical protein
MSGLNQQARVMRGAFADKLPPRDVESEAVAAWRAVDRLTTADTADLIQNRTALLEMSEKLDAMITRALNP